MYLFIIYSFILQLNKAECSWKSGFISKICKQNLPLLQSTDMYSLVQFTSDSTVRELRISPTEEWNTVIK